MFGADPQGIMKSLSHTREEALSRLVDEARQRGGNAVVAMRFDTNELNDTLSEIFVYGAAVQAIPMTEAAKYIAQQLGYGNQSSDSNR